MQKDDNGGTLEMQDNGDGRLGRRWRWEADYCGGGDVGQKGQRRRRYGEIDTAEEETRDRQQKRCGMTYIAVLGEINDYGCRSIMARMVEVDTST